ncbi:hypothetical protein FNF28_07502 [Cafeteria roenbergensis]|uniref:Isochorismatase-like domain-containing protein n=1 Tax=Cafeteria roenbergensis TaxID=33653 RepID=A0A5A8C580_CAFRO|nr:hypothetical protein FNF28_07502 [Cafeteria roenbergensis]
MESTAAAVLLVCDIQERFKDAIWHFDVVAKSAAFLADVCTELGVEAIATEQVPESMKPLVAVAKSSFSMLVPAVRSRLAAMAREGQSAACAGGPSLAGLTVVLVGIESHVCVQQTACALLAAGARVLVPADGVSSSRPAEHSRALRHLSARGADVVSCESVAFELLGSAAHPAFRAVQRLVKARAAAMDAAAAALLAGSTA